MDGGSRRDRTGTWRGGGSLGFFPRERSSYPPLSYPPMSYPPLSFMSYPPILLSKLLSLIYFFLRSNIGFDFGNS